MPRAHDYIPIGVQRSVSLHSFGRCQYRSCDKRLVTVDPVSGEITNTGVLAHILPVGEGPRAEFKIDFPTIDLNSAANLMLLCVEHHQLIDQLDVANHSPHILFRMKGDKSILISDSITELLELQTALQSPIGNYQREYQIAEIVDSLYRARQLGPRYGLTLFRGTERTLKSLLANPFYQKNGAAEVLLSSEHHFTKLYLLYDQRVWRDALHFVHRVLRTPPPDAVLFHVFSCSLVLVRDEYAVFSADEKTTLIAQLIKATESRIEPEARPGPSALLLLIKAALLRWRARFERGPNQRKTFGESQRCSDLSYALCNNVGCLLQSALISYNGALAFSLSDAPKHTPFIEKTLQLLESEELSEFPSAIKYRPRVYREIYRFADSVKSFWDGAGQYPREFRRCAFVIAEAALGEYYYRDPSDLTSVADGKAFVQSAIEDGYGHGRNIVGYVGCKGVLDPDWFKRRVLGQLLTGLDANVPWGEFLKQTRNSLHISDLEQNDPAFGIDEAEFWNTIAEVTARVLHDHETAIRLFRIAENHAEVGGGRFRAFVGLARQYKARNQLDDFGHYRDAAAGAARAFQKSIVDAL